MLVSVLLNLVSFDAQPCVLHLAEFLLYVSTYDVRLLCVVARCIRETGFLELIFLLQKLLDLFSFLRTSLGAFCFQLQILAALCLTLAP